MKRFVIAGVVLALLAIGVPAGASSRGSAPVYDKNSCIDTNRNGLCTDPGDISLAAAFAIDTSVNRGDLILRGYNVLRSSSSINVLGDVHVDGAVKLTSTSDSSTILSSGNVFVADAANVSGPIFFWSMGKVDANGRLTSDGNVTIGNNVHLTSGNKEEAASLHFKAAGKLAIGAGGVHHAVGGYAKVILEGDSGVSVAPGQTFTAPNHGEFDVISQKGDLTIDHFYGKGGYFHFETTAGNITLSNSTIIQTYLNGDLRILSTPPPSGPWTLNFVHDTITYKQVDHQPLYIPDPTITP